MFCGSCFMLCFFMLTSCIASLTHWCPIWLFKFIFSISSYSQSCNSLPVSLSFLSKTGLALGYFETSNKGLLFAFFLFHCIQIWRIWPKYSCIWKKIVLNAVAGAQGIYNTCYLVEGWWILDISLLLEVRNRCDILFTAYSKLAGKYSLCAGKYSSPSYVWKLEI